LGAGEGSLVICGSENAAKELRSWCNFGFFDSRNSRRIGTNAKMSEISAAYGLASLDSYTQEASEWSESLMIKNQLLAQVQSSNFSDTYPGFRPYWIYDCKDIDAPKLHEYLATKGIDSRFWWPNTISSMPAFQGAFKSNGNSKVAQNLATRLLGLPMWRGISNKELQLIVDEINVFSGRFP
jgi:dTDP-4-amino-4,6-dideoxygalactose transaminase